jgi:hypothetical protein
MGVYNTHGMFKDLDDLEWAIDALGMSPEELVVLADNAEKESWIYAQTAKHMKGQDKRKMNLMAGFWRRRTLKFKELAAAEEARMEEYRKEKNAV